MKNRILWIEGKRANSPSFVPHLRKRDFQVEIVPTGSAAQEILLELDPDLVVIHAASLRSTGKRTCQNLRQISRKIPIVLIVDDQTESTNNCANVSLKLPFTARKLLNRIIPLLPANEDQMLHIGPIRLYTDMKKVRCQGREAKLTPRLTKLLRMLMENPGTVVEREVLFKEVWNTQYTGDTRTLDVHISWLREAIEEDSHHPKLLKTIRGVGYRLDVS
jgi:DNA-binding response OmpR family regulator